MGATSNRVFDALICQAMTHSSHFANILLAGNTYSIRNVGSGTARVFFAQARETSIQDED